MDTVKSQDRNKIKKSITTELRLLTPPTPELKISQ